MAKEDIRVLLEKFAAYCDSPENMNRKKFWRMEEPDQYFPIERWRGCAAKYTDTVCTMSMDISGYAPMLDFDCVDYYSDPEENLRQQLRYTIWDYENIPCGRYFEKSVFCSLASVYDASFFGAKIHFLHDQAPWYDETEPVIKDKADLLKIKPFDFNTTGLVPLVTKMYEHHVKATEGMGIVPYFPTTMRSQFSTAIMLRGFEPLLMDMIDDPDFFEDLMSTITGVYKEYAEARRKYLGEESYIPGILGNDEISVPMISPGFYREYIYPFEKEIGEFWGGVRYWHSCGKTEAYYEDVATLPGLKLMHIGPWSDIAKAVEVFGPTDKSIEICLNSNRDLFEKDYDQMVADLQRIKDLCEGKVRYQIRMDGIAIFNSLDFTLGKMRDWVKATEAVFPVK